LAWTTNVPTDAPTDANVAETIAEPETTDASKEEPAKKVRKQKTKKTAVEPETTDAPIDANVAETIAEPETTDASKEEPAKKVRKQKTKKTAVEPETTDAPTDANVAETIAEPETTDASKEEPAKKVRKQKVKEPVAEPINFEEMSLNAIREYMTANGLDKQLVKLDAVFAKLNKTKKKETKPRAPSVFNLFMKEEMASLKEQNPEKNHRELFSMASSSWKTSSKNPKNQQEE
jgi:hypothetical protein